VLNTTYPEICPKSNTAYCDGVTPTYAQCHNKLWRCEYASSPALPRTVALKLEQKQLRSSHNNLLRLFRQLHSGCALEVANLVENIRSGEETFGLTEGMDQKMARLATSSTSSPTWPKTVEASSGCSNRKTTDVHSERTISWDCRCEQRRQSPDSLSHVGVSHKAFFWPREQILIRVSGAEAPSEVDLQCIFGLRSLQLSSRERRTQ
jgi:hypothetical protein